MRTILRNLRVKPKSALRTTVEQLFKEVFELLMEFKPVSDKSEEPVERSGLAS